MNESPSTPGKEKLDQALQAIFEFFDEEWLKLGSNPEFNHPLQQLWNRSDPLARMELLIFGDALVQCKKINIERTKALADDIKGSDGNRRRGALYEIFIASAFNNSGKFIVEFPRDPNNPGYDLILNTKNEQRICVSVKNFGIFQRAEEIRDKSRELEKLVQDNINNGMYSIIILNKDFYPDVPKWGTLRDHLPLILGPTSKSMQYSEKIEDGWDIKINYAGSPSNFNKCEILPEKPSYIFSIYTRLHPNDEQNLKDKLEDGCDNLEEHGDKESINAIFIRVPEEMPLELCSTWSRDYLESGTNACVSIIILYQPIVVEVAPHTNSIAHCCKYIVRSADAELNLEDLKLIFAFGKECTSTPPIELRAGNKKIRCSDTEYYRYQSGYVYLKPIKGHYHVEIIEGILAESFDPSGSMSALRQMLPANNKLTLL